MNLAFMGAPGPFEILLILFVILLLFGARKLPELSRSLGRSLSEFKKGRQEGADSLKELKPDGVKLNAPDAKSGDAEGEDKDKPSD